MKVPDPHVTCAAVLLALVTAGCLHIRPDTPVSQTEVAATQPDTPEPAAEPTTQEPTESTAIAQPAEGATPRPEPVAAAEGAAAATPQPAPVAVPSPTVTTPAPRQAAKAAPSAVKTPAPTPAPAPQAATAPAAAPPAPTAPLPLDLAALKERLRATKAIGVFTKISLKNKVDDLLDEFRAYHAGKGSFTMTDLRRSYNLLMMKVLSLLQDEDQTLASTIVSSREAIWSLLANPTSFAALKA